MLIALPNPDKTFTCTLFLAFEADQHTQNNSPSFDQLNSPESVMAFFESYFPDVIPLIPDLLTEFSQNPIGALATIHAAPWHGLTEQAKLLLIGDAAHAIVPFFGQGMNAAFEDCTLLMRELNNQPDQPDWANVFKQFYHSRKPDADAIAALALENFIEMRDQVADPSFLVRKQVSLRLENQYPELFIPKYSLVSFHRVPYSVAVRHGELQTTLLNQLCQGVSSVDEINWQQAEQLMQQFKAEAPALNET